MSAQIGRRRRRRRKGKKNYNKKEAPQMIWIQNHTQLLRLGLWWTHTRMNAHQSFCTCTSSWLEREDSSANRPEREPPLVPSGLTRASSPTPPSRCDRGRCPVRTATGDGRKRKRAETRMCGLVQVCTPRRHPSVKRELPNMVATFESFIFTRTTLTYVLTLGCQKGTGA